MDNTLSPREALLLETKKIVTGDRNKAYGNPEDNFKNIADLWSAYWRGKTGDFSSMDVVCMMTLMKLARLKTNPGHRDSLVDTAGYAACGADIQATMQKIPPVLTAVVEVSTGYPTHERRKS